MRWSRAFPTWPLAALLVLVVPVAACNTGTHHGLGSNAKRTSTKAQPIALGIAVADPGNTRLLDSDLALLKHPPAVIAWTQSWSDPLFYDDQRAAVLGVGAVPLIYWTSIGDSRRRSLTDIASGKDDAYLRQSAELVKTWPGEVMIAVDPEMNVRHSVYGTSSASNTAAEFIAAWRHVVSVFRSQGVKNVLWVWAPNVNCQGGCNFQGYYPGNSWVDWVGLVGFNYAADHELPWMTFSELFRSSYDELSSLSNKPMLIAATSSTAAGGNKAIWITEAFKTIDTMTRVHAVVWFDRKKELNWRFNSSSSALHAFQQVDSSAEYRGTLSTVRAP
jgi:hypothetical protein